jgi:hypothetical protein
VEAPKYRPQGHAAMGRSTFVKPPALPEVADSRAAEVVKLCFFVELTQEQAATELGVSISTVERTWSFARAWLFREIKQAGKPPV